MTASTVPPVSAASLTAQRRPARDDGEPSTPATIRGALLVLLAGIRTSPSALFCRTPELLRLGPEAVLYAILDQVVDEYAPVVAGLENDIDEIEDQLFRDDPAVSRRIYELSREVIEFQRATHPLLDMLTSLEAGFDKYKVDLELQRSLRDVHDLITRSASSSEPTLSGRSCRTR